MQHQESSSEVTFHHHTDDATFKKRIRKTTIQLSIVTVIELGIGLYLYTLHRGGDPSYALVLSFKGLVCALTLLKAYWIVSVFMHLGDEIRNMIMTIVVPLMLFIWFIIAFIADGNSYKNLRNEFDLHFKETTMPKKHVKAHDEAPVKEEGGKQ
jgi:cytochrome c oxidase subunit 4